MRDELSSYTIAGRFNINEDSLVSQELSWKKKVDQINYEPKNKLIKQWEKLKIVISFCLKQNIQSEKVLPIFITSQNFDQITKRLLLFIKDHK